MNLKFWKKKEIPLFIDEITIKIYNEKKGIPEDHRVIVCMYKDYLEYKLKEQK